MNLPLRLAVLGATGSIGRQTLDVIRQFPERLKVIAMAAGNNLPLFRQQLAEFKPEYVSCLAPGFDPGSAECLTPAEMAVLPEVDIVVVALPGSTGLAPTLAATGAGKIIALSNKECLVSAGDILMAEARRHHAQIRPVDSEHSAIWQCLVGESSPAEKIILTASGGPFREYAPKQLSAVTPEQALAHPSWKMGRKVTLDSATLMNKGLEVIEAHRLYGLPYDRIEVVIHPQSMVHSMVQFADGGIKAQLSPPDMRLPIQYAFSYPERWSNDSLPRADWATIGRLDFATPDFERFPCLALAIEAGKKGNTWPAVLAAAGEEADELFLTGRIGFTDIARLVGVVLKEHTPDGELSLDSIADAESWARRRITELARSL
ncbi:1-deoxy-D-xylulose 5-phosphate reductoisomerase [Dehalogenimonas lykanthroporepellens BL-DC-9]|jgi:1-deoxy-D-xylulose-5-phosphate reductoisomerase|nr:1-deoxy-D-xylulose 5-phosphate reductoisomerase [Dehalogenimonas lykanthroporepellens BL-DC-9]